MPDILFWSAPAVWADYAAILPCALDEAGVRARLSPDLQVEEADYIVYAPSGERLNLGNAPRLRAVFSLWAGVESVLADVPAHLPLARMVDEGLTEGMVEYVTGHVLRHHLGLDRHINNPGHEWRNAAPPLARDRIVAILGLGALGAACARALRALNFPVRGWSRSSKALEGVETFHGQAGLAEALTAAEIVVLLLPHTPQTENLLDAAALARLAPGAAVINPGRGALIHDADLLAALESGQVGHATLDTFRTEPLPASDPYWAHPRVTVTAHIASATRPATAARVIAGNIARAEAGEPILHLVDRTRGY